MKTITKNKFLYRFQRLLLLILLLSLISTILASCGSSPSTNNGGNTPVVNWNNQSTISVGFTKYGSMTVITGSGLGVSQHQGTLVTIAASNDNYFYITGKYNNGEVLFQFLPFNQNQAYQKQVFS